MNQKSRKASQIKEFRLRARSAYPNKIIYKPIEMLYFGECGMENQQTIGFIGCFFHLISFR
jgi:hypothetical protein